MFSKYKKGGMYFTPSNYLHIDAGKEGTSSPSQNSPAPDVLRQILKDRRQLSEQKPLTRSKYNIEQLEKAIGISNSFTRLQEQNQQKLYNEANEVLKDYNRQISQKELIALLNQMADQSIRKKGKNDMQIIQDKYENACKECADILMKLNITPTKAMEIEEHWCEFGWKEELSRKGPKKLQEDIPREILLHRFKLAWKDRGVAEQYYLANLDQSTQEIYQSACKKCNDLLIKLQEDGAFAEMKSEQIQGHWYELGLKGIHNQETLLEDFKQACLDKGEALWHMEKPWWTDFKSQDAQVNPNLRRFREAIESISLEVLKNTSEYVKHKINACKSNEHMNEDWIRLKYNTEFLIISKEKLDQGKEIDFKKTVEALKEVDSCSMT